MNDDYMSRFYCYPTIHFPTKEIIQKIDSMREWEGVSEKLYKYKVRYIRNALVSAEKILKQMPKNTHPQALTDIVIISIIRALGLQGKYKGSFIQYNYQEKIYHPLPIAVVNNALQEVIQKGNVPKRAGEAISKNLRDAFNRIKNFMPRVVKDGTTGEIRMEKPAAQICTY